MQDDQRLPPGRVPGAPDPAFWAGRRVLVTGHTGFKGSWLALWLEALKANVTGYALAPPTEPNLFRLACADASMKSVLGDVRNLEHVSRVVADARPEVLIHMAAQSVVRTGYSDPVETYATNVMGTVNVLEALRRSGLACAVVNVTTDKCYAPRSHGPGYRENEPMGGHDPYSNSKGCSELVTSAYRDSFFNPVSFSKHRVALGSARAGNVIGGGDWTAHQLIPDLLRAFAQAEPCRIRSPNSIRPWQFVLEPLRGYLLLAERLSSGAASFASGWNFGPVDEDARPVSWIADRLARAWGDSAAWVVDGAEHPHEDEVLRLDASRAGRELGWRPAMPLGDALDWIVEWTRRWRAGEDARTVTRAQIVNYSARLVQTAGS